MSVPSRNVNRAGPSQSAAGGTEVPRSHKAPAGSAAVASYAPFIGIQHTWLAADQEKIILNMHQELDRYLSS
jgi:hypothetical protein